MVSSRGCYGEVGHQIPFMTSSGASRTAEFESMMPAIRPYP